jgi:hypothetical protein
MIETACRQMFSETVAVWLAASLMLTLLIIVAMVLVLGAIERLARARGRPGFVEMFGDVPFLPRGLRRADPAASDAAERARTQREW